jgi:hypothetical protein
VPFPVKVNVKIKIKIDVKGVGQECPTHTGNFKIRSSGVGGDLPLGLKPA